MIVIPLTPLIAHDRDTVDGFYKQMEYQQQDMKLSL